MPSYNSLISREWRNRENHTGTENIIKIERGRRKGIRWIEGIGNGLSRRGSIRMISKIFSRKWRIRWRLKGRWTTATWGIGTRKSFISIPINLTSLKKEEKVNSEEEAEGEVEIEAGVISTTTMTIHIMTIHTLHLMRILITVMAVMVPHDTKITVLKIPSRCWKTRYKKERCLIMMKRRIFLTRIGCK